MKYITEFDPKLSERPLSYSSLKAFQKSPQHFVLNRMERREPTAAMAFGSVIDCLKLTPEDYETKFVIIPEDIKKPTSAQVNAKKPSEASIEQIQKYNAFCEENKGKTWVEKEDAELAKFLAEKTFNNEKAKDLLNRVVRTQDRISWTNKESGLPMIGYKDATGDTFIMDLKTANDGSPDKFMKSAFDFGYHIQAAAYLDAERVLFGRFVDYYFLVVETVAPYNISVYKATNDFINLGFQEYNELLNKFKFCMENNLWYQGYEFHSATGYHQLDIPGWAKNKLNK
jgi:exodeoxyribonuclease VIII